MNNRNDELLECQASDYKTRLILTGLVILIVGLLGAGWYVLWTVMTAFQTI